MKILHVVGRMDRAGQETFLMNVLREADLSKYEFYFSVNTSYIGAYEQEILNKGAHIFHNPYKIEGKNIFKHIMAFRNFLRLKGPFQIVHCHVYYFGGLIMWAAFKEKIPVRIMHSHNTNDGRTNSIYRKIYRALMFFLIKKYSTELVACGKDAYFALYKIECLDNNKILNNAISIDNFDEKKVNRKKKIESLGYAHDIEVLISVARFSEVKNHKKIIRVFYEYLKSINSKAVLLLVGDGELKSEIQCLVEHLKISESVSFLGIRNDVNELLLCADVFIMPSYFEGLPVSLIEAQAAGLPCLISSSITDEVDMGLGLICKLSIEAEDSKWSKECWALINSKKRSFEERKNQLFEHGYTIDSTWIKLELLYDRNNK